MVRFHQDEKPTTGTHLPIQAATGMINTTCVPLNVKVTAAEWTPSQNLILCFSQGSIKSQIKKAGSTILGTIARDCPRAIFMKCEKCQGGPRWSLLNSEVQLIGHACAFRPHICRRRH